MDGSIAQIEVDVFDTDWLFNSAIVSQSYIWQMFQWDISITFTNAKAEEEICVRILKSISQDLFPGYNSMNGGQLARLKRIYMAAVGTKFFVTNVCISLIELVFKSVAGLLHW